MHVINQLYSPRFDFLRSAGSLVDYMIATVPRTGSTFFSIKLWQTGLLGAPMEYLNFPAMGTQMMPRLGCRLDEKNNLTKGDILEYWGRVRSLRTSGNGVFGHKMFMTNFKDIVDKYPDLFEQILPDYVIYLQRRDVIGQAISYSRAIRTKAWFAGVNAAPISYDYNHLAQAYNSIIDQYSYWDGVFLRAGVEPIRMYYEDLLADQGGSVEQMLTSMGIEADISRRIEIPNIDRQADEVTDDWREKFQNDRAELDGSAAM